MAVLLMRLRQVPYDELEEIRDLLEANELAWYETTSGLFGISMPGLWLVDDSRADEAKALLENYAHERQRKTLDEYAQMRAEGRERTVFDILRESPLRFVVYLMLILAMLALALFPFLNLVF